MEKIVAAIPARAGSVRIPHKNSQKIGAHTLVERKVLQLKASKLVTDVVVATNDDEVAATAAKVGAIVTERSEFAADEKVASANNMIADIVNRFEADIVLWAHCTNPFIYARHYDAALTKFLEAEKGNYDSVLSVYKVQNHMWNKHGLPINYNPYAERHTLAKEIDPVYCQDGAIFIQRHAAMVKNSYFFGNRPLLFEIDFPYSHDINDPIDLEIARCMHAMLDQQEGFAS